MTNIAGDLLLSRRQKLQRLIGDGVNPFPTNYTRTHILSEAVSLLESVETPEDPHIRTITVSTAGRIMAMRGMGKASFIDIQDVSGKLQVHLRRDILDSAYEIVKNLDIGDFIGVTGRLFRTRSGQETIEAQSITFLGKALRPLPEKWHGLSDVEIRFRQRYLDLISNPEIRSTFQTRSKIISAIRRFLDTKGFLEVETPILVPVAAGAHAQPFTTHYNALGNNLYLRIATELYLKRLIIGGFDKVYEIGRVFRNEGIDLDHNPEFTLLESYEAYADYEDVMVMVEQMVSTIAREVLGTTSLTFGGNTIDLAPPWNRVSMRDNLIEKTGVDFFSIQDITDIQEEMRKLGVYVDERSSRGKLIDKLVSSIIEPTLVQPTFLIDYPIDMSPMAKKKPDDPHTVERFEAFIGGMEIANSFSELNDPDDQRDRFMEQERLRSELGEELDRLDEDFLIAMEHGMPPTGGLGIGIDRLTMLFTGQTAIREVILFPQLKENR
jgi:lysyl-tRNA synthetase class 2